jgi:hypothetical protein
MKCPHCKIEVNCDFKEYFLGAFEDHTYYSLYVMHCPNDECQRPIVNLGFSKFIDSVRLVRPDLKQIYPNGSSRESAPIEVDNKLAEDYNEACLVLPYSPKASAALSRRCLQNIIRIKADIKEKNLKLEIDKLISTNSVPTFITDSLNIVRGFGNIAAHGMEDLATGDILDVEPNEAEYLLDVILLLFDFYFVQPARALKIKNDLNIKLKSAGKPIV